MRIDAISCGHTHSRAGARRRVRELLPSAAAWLLCFTAPVTSAVGIDYGIVAVISDFTHSPVVTSDQEVAAGHLPATAVQQVEATRRDDDGHAHGVLSFNALRGEIGYFAETRSATPDKQYRLGLGAKYDDSLTLATTSGQTKLTQATLTMTVEGDFTGSASQGGLTMSFSATTGQSAYLQVLRLADPIHPGFDEFTTWSDILRPPTTMLVPTGTTHHFTATMSLEVPVTAVSAATSFLSPSGLCVGQPPGCSFGIHHGDGSAAPAVGFSFDVTILSAGGRGMPLGESRIDLSHTASLGVQVPDDTYFLFESGALRDDPRSALTVVPVMTVPEPVSAACFLTGLALFLVRRSRRCKL